LGNEGDWLESEEWMMLQKAGVEGIEIASSLYSANLSATSSHVSLACFVGWYCDFISSRQRSCRFCHLSEPTLSKGMSSGPNIE
jgi:hypothetical protein